MTNYQQSIIDARASKRRTQQHFGSYWRQQMDWTQQKKAEIRAQPYDPAEVWTVEGPTRKA